MLQLIRERAQGWIAVGIVLIIVIPLAFFGIGDTGGGSSAGAISVNGVDISKFRIDNEVQRLYANLARQGQADMFPEEVLRQQVVRNLVIEELLRQATVDSGMRISDQAVMDAITAQPDFQIDGKFSPDVYRAQIASMGHTHDSYKERLREALLDEQFGKTVLASQFVTKPELDRLLQLQGQTRDVGYLSFSLQDALAGDITVTEFEVVAHYEENPDSYVDPEKVRIAYLDLDAAKLAADVQFSDEELRARYQAQLPFFTEQPEQRHISHILVEVAADADEATVAEARARIEAIQARIEAGENFAAVAAEASDDTFSAENGGELGLFAQGSEDLPDALMEVAFAMDEGHVSMPVHSEFGFHLIRVSAIEPAVVRPYESVRDELLAQARLEVGEQRYGELAYDLKMLTETNEDSLDEAAEALGLEVQQSELFSRNGGNGITAERAIISAAFSEAVLDSGRNSPVINLSEQRAVVLRVVEHEAAGTLPLDVVGDAIRNELLRNKATERLVASAEQAMARIAAGEDGVSVAAGLGVEWQRQQDVARGDTRLDQFVVYRAFDMPRPTADKPSLESAQLLNGDQAVVVVYGVTDGDAASVSDDERQALAERLKMVDADAFYQGLLNSLINEADIQQR